jgi:hypothetical protein
MQRRSIEPRPARGGFVALLPALAVAFVTANTALLTLYAPPAMGQMGVVFAPWVSESQAFGAVLAAGGKLANSSRFPNILVAVAPDEGFDARVRAAGALFTISALGLCEPAVGHEGDIS